MSLGMNGMDPSALRNAAAGALGNDGQLPTSPAAPEGDDVSRFRAAMEQQPPTDAVPPPAAPTGATAPTGVNGVEPTMGDRIIGGISSISDTIQTGRDEALSVLNKTDATQADLLRANFAMMESSTLVTAVSKTTEKITQGVKTLQQG